MSEMLQLGIFSSKAVLTVLLMAVAGAALVRFKFLKDESLGVLSQCVFAIMLPCLLFSKVAEKIDLNVLLRYWLVPASAVLFVFSGLLFGYIAAKLLRHPPHFFKAGVAASSFGNISFIPIPLIAAMTAIFPAFSSTPGSAAQGIAYISLYLMVYSPMLWSIGFRLLSAEDSTNGRIRFLDIVNPPLIGMACGILVGTIPAMKWLFIGQGALLSPLFNAAETVGTAAIPCAIIVLGGKLAYGPTHCALPLRSIIGISLVKLVILPGFALGCVWSVMKYGIIPKDPLLAVILVVEAAVPQATNLSIMCSLRNKAIEKDMACLLFWNYLASAPILAAFIVLTLWLLG